MPYCEVCGKELSSITATHRRSKAHVDNLTAKGLTSDTDPTLSTTPKATKAKTTSVAGRSEGDGGRIQALEHRVAALEDQIKYIVSKLSSVDVKIAPGGNNNVDYRQMDRVKPVIVAMVPRGESISVDSVLHDPRLAPFPPAIVERAIVELVDDETFDASEGRSEYKVRGSIGRLIRR